MNWSLRQAPNLPASLDLWTISPAPRGAVSVRVAVVPGRNVIGIELPNARRDTVYLREILESDPFERSGASLEIALGKDIGGTPMVVDLARMPHLLIAGTTGSGKSVAVYNDPCRCSTGIRRKAAG